HPQKAEKDQYQSDPASIDPSTITDYSYDVNGNLIKDLNKDLTGENTDGIQYNLLNLPSLIHVKNKGTIEYVYDASGNKLQKIVTENPGQSTELKATTSYIGSFIYESKLHTNAPQPTDYTDQLQFISLEEGRIR